jgi:hypothetical protein
LLVNLCFFVEHIDDFDAPLVQRSAASTETTCATQTAITTASTTATFPTVASVRYFWLMWVLLCESSPAATVLARRTLSELLDHQFNFDAILPHRSFPM